MTDGSNGRVTLARLAEKIDTLTLAVREMRLDHDRLIMAEGCINMNQRDLREIETLARGLDQRMHMAEIQLAKVAIFWGLLSGSGGAVVTVLITKALGL